MLKRFDMFIDAADLARATCKRLNTPVYGCTVYPGKGRPAFFLIATPVHVHMLPCLSYEWHPVTGYSGGNGVRCELDPMSDPVVEEPEVPDELERAYHIVACHTTGNHAQRLAIAEALVANKTCVWHESARYYGHLATCPCASCQRERKEPVCSQCGHDASVYGCFIKDEKRSICKSTEQPKRGK